MSRFALIGCGGYIAPRHLKAIKETGNELVAALDPYDSVGILDKYFPNTAYFTEFERFDRHCEKLRRKPGQNIEWVSICSPNYLHDAHIRFGLRIGANVICEKPLVLNPRNIQNLLELEKENNKKISTVLQLRYHPTILNLKKRIESAPSNHIYDIDLNYMTPRGNWYYYSWKGNISKSGGVATNIGIHFFDMLSWIFGELTDNHVFYSDAKKMGGYLEFEHARVRWFLSLDRNDLPKENLADNKPYRCITIDGEELEFSSGFTDLHTTTYQHILNGDGFGIKDALPSIQIVHDIRTQPISIAETELLHPHLKSYLESLED